MTVAAEIQRNLLPERSPRAQGFDVAGRSIPAGQTGGDSFDWLTLEDGRTVVTLADVTGHGIGPALLAANLHAYVHAIFTSPGGAGEWVARLNQSIGASLSEGRFVTFATAVLHPPTAAVELLSAGHGPILLYRAAQGEVSELTAHGVPLGVLAEAAFDEPTRLQMGRGDVLVLITDGFVEQVNAAGEQYGSDRLKDSLLRWASRDSGEIIAALYADVQAFAAAVPQADDLTVTVIRRTN
ncbi:MAG: serine/threonine-protein phosphatase [Planctomycetaceae bacterium]|nr:serine/threonine-protein phosphatase [Planctomycetaceae bacterium]